MADKIDKCAWIDKKVVEYASQGLSMKEIHTILLKEGSYQKLPQSMTTFRKNYYDTFLGTRSEEVGKVGQKIIDMALEGDYKSAELFLTTHSDAWQKKTQLEVSNTDDLDEEETALDILSGALGLGVDDDEGDTEPTEEAT